MYTIRCTQRLLKRLGTTRGVPTVPSTTLGDWHANLLRFGSTQMVLCTSERSLLPVVLPARGLKTALPNSLSDGVAAVLAGIGVPRAYIDRELRHMQEHAVGRTESRVVLGSMNDFAVAIEHSLRSGPRVPSLPELSIWLAGILCGPLEYDRPGDVARRLLELEREQSNNEMQWTRPG